MLKMHEKGKEKYIKALSLTLEGEIKKVFMLPGAAATVVLALMLLGFTGCKAKMISKPGIETIDIFTAYVKRNEVPVSYVADSIEYLLLDSSCGHETLDDPAYMNVIGSVFLKIQWKHIYFFNKNTGKFIKEVSAYGRGPEEHGVVNFYDERNNTVFTSDMNSANAILNYSLNGKHIRKLKKPAAIDTDFQNPKNFNMVTSYFPIAENEYAGYSMNYSGNNPEKLVTFDTTGAIKKRYLNYNRFKKKESKSIYINASTGKFYSWSDTVRFFEVYTDTIFTVTEGTLTPRYYLNMGELSPPYYLQSVAPTYDENDEHLKYLEINRLMESDRFLFFTFKIGYYGRLGYYDKKTKKTVICDYNQTSDNGYYRFSDYPIRNIGFINDIDCFLPVGTGKNFYINKRNELITYILASDVERWFHDNPDKVSKLPERLRKFSNVKATDNIIVEVVHLKK